ncbi:MAG: hypothetical protein AAGG11_03350 [Pseudomonadota bacterium]
MKEATERDPLPPEQPQAPEPRRQNASGRAEERQFHGWRLLGIIFLVIAAIAVVSAIVDWWVIGPLEGRAPWL